MIQRLYRGRLLAPVRRWLNDRTREVNERFDAVQDELSRQRVLVETLSAELRDVTRTAPPHEPAAGSTLGSAASTSAESGTTASGIAGVGIAANGRAASVTASAPLRTASNAAGTPGGDYRAIDAPDPSEAMRQVGLNYERYANPFDDYRRLIDALTSHPGGRMLPLWEFADAEPAPGECLIGLRHDIDADPETGLRCARHLARCGVGGSFYLLPTAPYYGHWEQDLFVRSSRVKDWLRGFIVAGCEIGLHNDALGIDQRTSMNGARAIAEELVWLRSHGAVIRGTTAHNSLPSQGAENFEVFAGRRLWRREPGHPGDDRMLARVSEPSLDLQYEGTFATRHETTDVDAVRSFLETPVDNRDSGWMRRYLTDNPWQRWTVDVQLWVVGRSQWVIGGRVDGEPIFLGPAPLDEVLEAVRRLPGGIRLLVVLHPEYFVG